MKHTSALCGLLLIAAAAALPVFAQPPTPSASTPNTRNAAQLARQTKPETYYGLMTEEVARIRLQKMGFQQVPRIEKVTPSQGILRAEAMRDGQTHQIEINRQTGVTREVQ